MWAMWGFIYINADQLAALGDVLPGSSKQSIYQQYMGLSPDPSCTAHRMSLAARFERARRAVPAIRGMIKAAKSAESRFAGQIQDIKAMRPQTPDPGERECLAWIMRLESVTTAAWESLMIGPGIASATFEVCEKIVALSVGRERSVDLNNRLHAALGGNESAEAGKVVRTLAALALQNPALTEALEAEAGWSEIRGIDELFELELGKALERFGFHTSPELELAQPTWRQDPGQLLRMVSKEVRKGPAADRRGAALKREAELELERSTKWFIRSITRRALSLSRKQMAIRENSKIPIVLIFDELRRVIEAAGPSLVARDVVRDVSDVVYLRYDEVKSILGGSTGPTLDEVERRRSEHQRCIKLEVPELIEAGAGAISRVSQQSIAARGLLPPAEIATSNTNLTGVGASSGVFTGTARIMDDPFDDFEPGDILVAKTVDPGWSIALASAGAIVLDIGGGLSHGAVVARELGIPCVVNVKAGTAIIADGTTITVDGANGIVSLDQRLQVVSDRV
ncbi:hypothetical protein AXA44_45435 [Rhodococcus sp. SC4]|nr:hypothetical protein AXA44_45435 [Rhodococcus sp. SC4]